MRIWTVAVAALVLSSSTAGAQEWFSVSGQYSGTVSRCTLWTVDIPAIETPRNTRVSISFTPESANAWLWFREIPGDDGNGVEWGTVRGVGGHLEIDARLPAAPANKKEVCVGRASGDVTNATISYDARGTWTGIRDEAAAVPTASDWTGYDDEMAKEIIFDAHENPDGFRSQTSWMLSYPASKYYIRLGGLYGCGPSWRMTLDTLHYWRAVIPIIVEQVTGVPYTQRVEAGCEPRASDYGWVTVEYTTPQEYSEDTGRDWEADTGAWALIGSTYGRIWFRYDGHQRPLDQWHKETIAHEIGHTLGLRHSSRSTAIMTASGRRRDSSAFHVLTPEEETVARRAFELGRGAKYCDIQQNGGCANYQPNVSDWPGVAIDLIREPPLVSEPPAPPPQW